MALATITTMLFHTGNILNAQNMKTEVPKISAFPTGEENTGYAQYFSGKSWLALLTFMGELNVPINNVTFEPACRNNWHSHTGGQILVAVGGTGYYQERGKVAVKMVPGDVVEIAPDVEHWHGAAPDSWFSHLAIACNPKTNQNVWLEPVSNEDYEIATVLQDKEHSDGYLSKLATTDPELHNIISNFAFMETQQYIDLDLKTRIMVTMVSAIALNTCAEYRKTVYAALANGITPIEVKEVLYHAVPYAGMGKVADLIDITNEVLVEKGFSLPLEPQSMVTAETRQEKGFAFQKSIFGERIDRNYETAIPSQLYIQKLLSANCFGDYQTRPALDVKMRELLTYSILISLGGCESQVKGHIQGNVNVGNDKATLLAVTTQLLPTIGYPRTLNAIACLNEIIPQPNE